MFEYKEDKTKIAKRIARIFKDGDYVNLGIGLPTLVGNYVPEDVHIVLQSENGFLGLGEAPGEENFNPDIVNAGGVPCTIIEGACFFDSATSFGIIRGGHLDYTVLGVLEADQEGNLANYMIPGKMVPGMGGAMDLLTGAKKVIAATVHFDKKGNSKMVHSCSLPLTAKGEVDIIVTDLGMFEVKEGNFILKEYFAPATPEWIVENTRGNIVIDPECREFKF
ncbi:3-oxoacid CoA-transferase subunit B [Spirochaeta isovalerica]|uniref:Acetate CoA/acetoacetate CoA-transferase beta subunit n=1 Tax=Spirochaeta isovalerica TaxID=150 RepID=A0A841R2W8_9SPIO|nr:3-oxoacid CoA-transferase subunit B [Spirochaeta isovalerica]MBB6479384.1 acetate CoA/acetoacetate CoA-transferase beta subunit [Spirochaeta isovalerica]